MIVDDRQECNQQKQQESCLSVGSVIERILRMQRVHRCGADVVAWIHAKFGDHLDDELIYGDLTGNCQDVQLKVSRDIFFLYLSLKTLQLLAGCR